MKTVDKNTSVFPSMDLPHTEARKREAGGPRSVAAVLDRKGWKRVRLGVFEQHRNNTCPRSLTTVVGGGTHNIHYGDILVRFGEIVSLKQHQVDALTEEGEAHSPKDYLQDGDIVIADTAEDETAGKVAEIQDVTDRKAVAGLHTIFLRPPTGLFVRGWLGYWMNSNAYHNQLLPYLTGIKVLSLSKSNLANTEVFYPSKGEQKRIVSALSSIDTHISALEALIAKYEAIKKATVNLLLQPEMGWRQVKIKDFCPLQRGFDLPKHSRHRGVFPLVCSNGVSDRIDKYLVKAPGVVTGRSGTIGNVHFLGENFWPHNTTLWVSSFIDADPLFVFYLLSELGLSRFSGGSGVPTLNRNDVHDTLVEVPSIAGQHEIAEQIATIDKTISDCKAQLEKARQLKSGMMSYFFG